MNNKTRFALFLLAVLLLAGILPLSGGAGMQAQAKTNDSNYLVYYADVINNYKTVIKKNFYRGGDVPDKTPKYVSPQLLYLAHGEQDINTVYYTLYDINGNGFPELIVGEPSEYRTDSWEIFGIFSYTDKIKPLSKDIDFWGYRSHATIHTNGTVAVMASGGAYDAYWLFYGLTKSDQPKVIDALHQYTWNCERYYRGKEIASGNEEDVQEITKKKTDQLCKKYTGQNDKTDLTTDVKLSWKKINSLPKITGPNKPTDLRVTAVNTTALNLKWNKVKGAKGYEIFCRDAATKKYVLLASSKKAAVKLTGLTPDTAYQFAVRACCKPEQKVLYSNYSVLLPVKTAK